MKAERYPGAGVAGAGVGDLAALMFPDGVRSLTLYRALGELYVGAGVAFCALAANHALHGQIALAYRVADCTRAQSRSIAGLSEAAESAGPARDALLATARLAESFADEIVASASGFGRAFGHLAFAFPVAVADS